MDTCITGRGHVSHYKQPGSHLTYCGRTAGTPGVGTRMCTRCVTAESRDRAEATATAEAWLDQPPASPTYNDRRSATLREAIAASGGMWDTNRVAATLAAAGMPTNRNTCWGLLRSLAVAEGYTPAGRLAFTAPDPTGGTWRAAWISSRAASPAPTLFDVEPDTEQGALFA